MIFTELLEKRRSIRNFKDKVVSLETINHIIKDSILAPSAGNGQPWEFIIVNDKEMINRISAESKKNMLDRIAANPHDFAKKYEKMLQSESFNIFYNAPSVILILGNSTLKNLQVDCALAASYFMLSATSRGLGTCWVNFALAIQNTEICSELGMSENQRIVAPIALGYPEVIPKIPNRKEPKILKVIK
ncbi:nitroreductase family protein [Candidatus Cloacimonadota bacterium]